MVVGLCRRKNIGDLVPQFTPGATFRLQALPLDGILTRIDFYLRGDHTTNITTPQVDGQVNIINDLRVTINRKAGLQPIVWNVRPRDLVHITRLFDGQLPANANPTASLATHFDLFSIFLAPPPHLVALPTAWGLDTAEIANIIIEGSWGAVTDIGTGATIVTTDVSVTTCSLRRTGVAPIMALAANQNFVLHESDARLGPDDLGVGQIDALWLLYLRHNDQSAQAAQRVDGLITRHFIDHSEEGRLNDEFFIMLKKATGLRFKLAAADLAAGVAISEFAAGALISDMPSMMEGQKLSVEHDSAEVVPVEVTDVTPAAGDGIMYIPIGGQFTAAGEARRRAGVMGNQGRGRGRGRPSNR